MNLHPFRHYIFYAKCHYKQTELFSDLKSIQCDYVGCNLSAHITIEDIVRVTSRAVHSVRGNLSVEEYAGFLLDYGKVYKGGFTFEYASLQESIILANLGILRHLTVDEIASRNNECLGEPDFTILPKGY